MSEIQSAMVIAKRFPRNEKQALDRILNACSRPGLAEVAVYSYAKGGSSVDGPTIRLAEAIAQYWGNIRTGIVELSRGVNDKGVTVSEAKAYSWDVETNFYEEKIFTVPHWRDTKQGGYPITEERDIYELVANMGARRKRACLLATIPGDIVEEARNQCEATLRAKADNSPETQMKIVDAFADFGITKDQIEKRIQRRMDAITPAQVISLKKVMRSLKDGMSTAEDWFESTPTGSSTNPFEDKPAAEPRKKKEPAPKSEPVPAKQEDADEIPMESAAPAKQDSRFVNEADERASLISDIKETCNEQESNLGDFGAKCRQQNLLLGTASIRDIPMPALRTIHGERLAILKGEYKAGGEA